MNENRARPVRLNETLGCAMKQFVVALVSLAATTDLLFAADAKQN
jgi:hypothetical protein